MSALGFDLAEFEKELASGVYDHLKPVQAKRAQLKSVKRIAPANQVAASVLNSAVPEPTEIPKAVALVNQELEIHCGFCGCVHTFITARSVRRQYKNGRSHFATLTEEVEKEVAKLLLPTEKMLTKMSVIDCDNCREAEDF